MRGSTQEARATSDARPAVVDQVTDVPSCVSFLSGLGIMSSADATTLCQTIGASVPPGSSFGTFFTCLEGQVLGGATPNDALSKCGSNVSVSTSPASGSSPLPAPSSTTAAAADPGVPPPPPPFDSCGPDRGSAGTGYGSTSAGHVANYPQGWSLVGVPPGTNVAAYAVALYSWDPSAKQYTRVPSGTPLPPGVGYWGYFNRPSLDAPLVQVPLTRSGTDSVSITLPAGQWVLVGNPFYDEGRLSGADALCDYNSRTNSYQRHVGNLDPGNGVWAYSANGGTVTVSWTGIGLP